MDVDQAQEMTQSVNNAGVANMVWFNYRGVPAVALAKNGNNSTLPELSHVLSVSDVTFKSLSDEEIASYWSSGEPADKAGAYGIQGLAAAFISHLSGSYSGVMGLPLYETVQLLQKAGISTDSLVVS